MEEAAGKSTEAWSWPRGIDAITLFVEDLGATKQFYEKVFGRPPMFEDGDSAAFKFGSTAVNLLKVAAAKELIEPAPVGGPEAETRQVLTVAVEDVDATCRKLAGLGVELLNGPMDRPWGIRTASFRDPAGHVWEIAR